MLPVLVVGSVLSVPVLAVPVVIVSAFVDVLAVAVPVLAVTVVVSASVDVDVPAVDDNNFYTDNLFLFLSQNYYKL